MSYPRQVQVERAIRAVAKSGLAIRSVEVTPEGIIRVLTGEVDAGLNALAEWRAKRGHNVSHGSARNPFDIFDDEPNANSRSGRGATSTRRR